MMNRTTKILAGSEVAMGVIHCIATFTPVIAGGLEVLAPGKQQAVTYFSLMCGTLLMLGGTLVFLLNDKIKEYRFLQLPYKLTIGTLFLNGILAASLMPANPCAWLILALGVLLTLFSL